MQKSLKKSLSVFLSVLIFLSSFPAGSAVFASGVTEGGGEWWDPYIVTDADELVSLLEASGTQTVYIRLGSDIVTEARETMYAGGLFDCVEVLGQKCLDLNGYTLKTKLPFNTNLYPFSMFLIPAGASLTIEDSEGGGEIIFDRFIPSMGEVNYQTDIFLDRPLTVFDVSGELVVNGGEITAGHYESEYYTYTDGFIYLDSQPSPGWVNSITPGNAVIVRDGGSFTSNGGEYYGRGFIMDDYGDKEVACTAVTLCGSAEAVINAGDFYGKSNADVFAVDSTAQITVFSGNFYARYDSRITVNKTNGVATYVNVDCGMIGIPLRAFDHNMLSFTHIYVDGDLFNYTPDYTQSDDLWFMALGSSGTGATVTVETLEGNGTKDSPFLLKNSADIGNLFHLRRLSRTYVRLADDINDCIGGYTVYGNYVLDINGHTLSGKLGFNDWHETYTLFIIANGSEMTVEDGAGGGEIKFDRFIPSMGQTNEQTDIFLYRALTVFDVRGKLTVNSGEITAGHYESEYYTYTQKYLTGGSTNAGSVNSITPGCAVVVRDGGRFTSNGGEYYGRGFTVDSNGEKDVACSAVRLHNGAVALINGGDFYGKSNADVFYVAWGANAYVYSGRFEAQYDNRITVDKMNGVAYYVNVDCGRIGLPLRSFTHLSADRFKIKVGQVEYPYSSSFTNSQSDDFENLGSSGTGATVTVTPNLSASSQIVREDNINAGLTYSPTDHFELINEGAQYYGESFAPLPDAPYHVMNYYWKITKLGSSGWEDVAYESGAPVYNGYYDTDSNRLDLYDLARDIDGGMEHGATYRVRAYASEYWAPSGDTIYSVSDSVIEIDCVYERIGDISLPDGVTGIVWPEHGKKPVSVSVEQETFSASFSFEERSAGGTRYVPMSERSTFEKGGSYRLKVQITPKQYFRADASDSVTVGGKTVTEKNVSGFVLTGYVVPLEVLSAKIASVPVRGDLYDGVEISSASPLNSPVSGVSVSSVWYKDGALFTGTATYGQYRAKVTVTTQDPYVFTDATKVKVFGKDYTITNLSSDGLSGWVMTDVRSIECTHRQNTNSLSYDADYHYMICSVCGEELSRASHSFSAWVSQGPVDVRTCTGCGYQESVSNGNVLAPFIRLECDAPLIGDALPALPVCDADADSCEYESAVEWFVDGTTYEDAIPAGTLMEEGHVYYAQVKFRPKSGYYFDSTTVISTLDPDASEIVLSGAGYRHGEAILKFVPTAPPPSYGDANGDSAINTLDLTLIRQRLADPSAAVSAGADTNGDGELNTLDLTLLRQYLADPAVILGPHTES